MELKGKLIKGIGGLYFIRLESGEVISCKAKGAFRHESIKPCIGDDVTVLDDNGYVLNDISERKNCLIRPPISNVGVIFITFACAEPEPALLNIDKLTCIAEHCGIRPVILVTKSDIAPEKAMKLADIYEKSGFKTFVSGSDGEALNEIREYIHNECKGLITCFAGASGVGKSTLMTALFPELNLETGEISAKIARGKHTTRHVELYPLDKLFSDGTDGYIADTPGFSLLDFVRFDFFGKEDLVYTFPEFEKYIGGCRYSRCTHLCEDGCAIYDAVKRGDIVKSRHDSFVSLYNDLKGKNKWDK